MQGNAGVYQIAKDETRSRVARVTGLGKTLSDMTRSTRSTIAQSLKSPQVPKSSTANGIRSSAESQRNPVPGSITRSLPPNPKRGANTGRAAPTKAAQGILSVAMSSDKLVRTGKTSYLVDSDVYASGPNQSMDFFDFPEFSLGDPDPLATRIKAPDLVSPEVLIFPTNQSLSYLDGSLPGDYGFDPLGLFGPDGNTALLSRSWLQYSEVLHGRWAMLAVVGCVVPEYFNRDGGIDMTWFRTGFLPTSGSIDYGTSPYTLFAIQMTFMFVAEALRLREYVSPGSGTVSVNGVDILYKSSNEPAYPGGPFFNALNVVESATALNEYKWMEVKHGRIAMLAWLGFVVQAAVTNDGPLHNLEDHLLDPFGRNLVTNLTSTPL